MYLEVIVETLREAIDAEYAGADRLELVSAINEGGLTPSKGLIDAVCNSVDVPVQIMLRPHSKSFIYDRYDTEVLLRDLEMIKSTNAQGIVFGALNKDQTIDENLLNIVLSNKEHLQVTFHRAIDEAKDYESSLKLLLSKPLNTILTAGGCDSAFDGRNTLLKIKPLFKKHNIELLAGKGLNLDNLAQFYKETTINRIHIGSGAKSNHMIDSNKIMKIKAIK